MSSTIWTNPSIVEMAGNADPVEFVQNAARKKVLAAIEHGWSGPPFDPFQLAELEKIRVVPSQDVQDAMLTPVGRGYQIDFNPSQSRRRIRFSIAHELAHTLFPDCRTQVRHRLKSTEMREDDWQLEMLCNIAAGEFLMPTSEVLSVSSGRFTIATEFINGFAPRVIAIAMEPAARFMLLGIPPARQ